ncbi:hypothetical protein N7650_02920 [Pseudomonas sp. GD04058]|uniref:hypothetical protein n=1 Tax=Pseudomonas sp. GD04058 TaxID=2975429 RepID=UPI0024470F13|nr:hypothetical protein [Pseudomonas sp. GD04058]MDG9881780.1 hypothetical protein [Pseudomonas sp. GD04058]
MSFDFRHWLALACLLPAILLLGISSDMPVFRDAARIEAINRHEDNVDYRLKTERFNQAVKEELTPKLKLEGYGMSFLLLSVFMMQIPRGGQSGRRRLLIHGFGTLVLFPLLAIDMTIRDQVRNLYPAWGDSLGPAWLVIVLLDLALWLLLAPFLYQACRGMRGTGRVSRGVAALLALVCLVLSGVALATGDYVALAVAGGLLVFFGYFLRFAAENVRR